MRTKRAVDVSGLDGFAWMMNKAAAPSIKHEQVLKSHFASRWGVQSWVESARRLKTAADVLFNVHNDAFLPDGEPNNFEHTELDEPATLLYGYAIENAIKACVIRRTQCSGSSCKQIAGWNDHDLVALMTATGVSATPEQKLLLRSASAFLLWAGRYPATYTFTGKNGFLMEKQFDEASVDGANFLPPTAFDNGKRSKLDDLFKKLIEAAEK